MKLNEVGDNGCFEHCILPTLSFAIIDVGEEIELSLGSAISLCSFEDSDTHVRLQDDSKGFLLLVDSLLVQSC